ncbi:MAG: AraC family transcriptional regulator [Lachnospiraceae bacterium]|nr:AraC family transcriptional regulator [Lachnospiraceae bacterium]
METYAERFKLSQTLDEVLEIYRDAENFLKRDDGEKQELSKPVRDILLFIQNHYAEDITLDQIARTVELSRTYVSGLFKKELGVNLTNYITNYRIEKAKELLRETNLKSYEIAEKVGFLDESYFSRSFKKVTGMSPNAYKRGQRP